MNRKIAIQLVQNSCGAACLSMLLGPHNVHVSVFNCHKSMIKDERGYASILELVRITREKYKIKLRVYRACVKSLSLLRLPAILHWSESHFVILESILYSPLSFQIVDPYFGPMRISPKKLTSHYSGVAIVVDEKHDVSMNRGSLQKRISYYLYLLAVYPILIARRLLYLVLK